MICHTVVNRKGEFGVTNATRLPHSLSMLNNDDEACSSLGLSFFGPVTTWRLFAKRRRDRFVMPEKETHWQSGLMHVYAPLALGGVWSY